MSQPAEKSWRAVRDEIIRRISEREWRAGDPIPNEAELANTFGCARTTVNRAMRELAEAGVIERRRKAGTRVAAHPVRKASLEIPVIRLEVEGHGRAYRHRLIDSRRRKPPAAVARQLNVPADRSLLRLRTLHCADGDPYAYEDRWLNERAVPDLHIAHMNEISVNEWLVRQMPFTEGSVALYAAPATAEEAETLGVAKGEALFIVERTTWNRDQAVTWVRIAFAPGYKMRTQI